jgi:hypothetical protein
VLLDFEVDFLLVPTTPDEVLRLGVNEAPAIALVTRPLVLAAITRRVTAILATVLADSSASLRLMFPRAGGVLIDLYLSAGIVSIVCLAFGLGQEVFIT